MLKYFLFLLILPLQTASPQPHPIKKIIWFDATANFERFRSKDSIVYYLNKIRQTGFTDVVVDIKPITGEVLYKSSIAPQMKEWKNYVRTDFDYLGFCIEEAHKVGLKVHASMNVFAGGHNYYNRGIVYDGKSSWQSINYTDSGLVPITRLKHKYSAMLNPALPEVQEYELSIIKEVVSKYPHLDGIILDRVRFDGIESDFSERSEEIFNGFYGKEINFPDDVITWEKKPGLKSSYKKGKYFNEWLEWRVSVIYNFFKRTREEIKKVNPLISLGDYSGAWYPVYFDVGVNWASCRYDPSEEYDWASAGYKNYGYAELLDLFTSGNYFYEVTKEEVALLNDQDNKRTEAAMTEGKEYWYSVEGSTEIVNKVIMDAVPVYAGLYVDQYGNNPEQFKRAIEMCLKHSDGVMIFDIVHIINKDWWEVLGNVMEKWNK